MGGSIWATSRVGFGSTFKFKINIATDVKKLNYFKDGLQNNINKEVLQLADDKNKKKAMNILLVDDAKDNHLIFKRYLFNLPHHIVSAENGLEAVNKFVEDKFDLVLMDIQMPIMDGYSATKQIRAWEKEHHRNETPIIAFTAHAFEEDIYASHEAGCNDHIVKPLKKDKLLSILEKYAHD